MSRFDLLLIFVVTPLLIADVGILLASIPELTRDCAAQNFSGGGASDAFMECSTDRMSAQLVLGSLILGLGGFGLSIWFREFWSWVACLTVVPVAVFLCLAAQLVHF